MLRGALPSPHDTGFGLCWESGGAPTADTRTGDGVRRRMGRQMTTFCDARFDVVRRNRKPESERKRDGLSHAKTCSVVLGLVCEGTII